MKLKEFIMVVCRNAGRCFGVANRSEFYHDFLRSLYDQDDYPAFYDNKVSCLVYYTQRLGYLPKMQVNDESKEEHYIYYYDPDQDSIECTTIKKVIMRMYNPENEFKFALASLQYTCSMFTLFKGHLKELDLAALAMKLGKIDLSRYSGEETIESIDDPLLSDVISESFNRHDLFGINKPQDRIENKRKNK